MIHNCKSFVAGTVYGCPVRLEAYDIHDEMGKRTACEFIIDRSERGKESLRMPVMPPIKATTYDPSTHDIFDSRVDITAEDVEALAERYKNELIKYGSRP